jgi:hypothetical protein
VLVFCKYFYFIICQLKNLKVGDFFFHQQRLVQVILATWEAEAGGPFEFRHLKQDWATKRDCHSKQGTGGVAQAVEHLL